MIHFDLPKQKSSIIKVLGVGGGGSNAVNYMFNQDIEGVDFIICNTDAKALEQSRVPNKIQLGPHLTQGLGAGANPEVGKNATEESLEEIKRILEVNTKMAFICAGMGGGTGTGGAPIIAKICRDLGILTVGIVTTPFGFEGPRRLLQAENGIRELQPYVDTLLVISNDKLRMQYGNLKMKEAFGKADNVLATAAKCITDIINSRGHIIVDFADVCTVMKNGGVAILGSAAVEGEDRAQRAIEEALNSPLLNDSDIQGAKWILVNLNSAEGEHECTMDEMEIISSHLRMQAGDNTDVIIGMGYENSLHNKIGITLIATGFEHKDPFAKQPVARKPEPKVEKIVMTLGMNDEEKKMYNQPPLPFADKDPFAPTLTGAEEAFNTPGIAVEETPVMQQHEVTAQSDNPIFRFELSTEITGETKQPVKPAEQPTMQYVEKPVAETKPVNNSFLNKPSNIYSASQQTAQPKAEVKPAMPQPQPQPQPERPKMTVREEPTEEPVDFQLVIKEDNVAPVVQSNIVIDDFTEEEEQKKRAAERLHKLRNLSYNMNTTESNTEFDNVPAYVRRNMELFGNTLTSVENFYSKYMVKKDENEQGQISTINTFLDGKKPD